jgi:Hypothetical protein (DUF2513)
MKRDWDCIRAIFLALEDKADSGGALRPAQIKRFDEEFVSYNMRLLIQAELIEGSTTRMVRGAAHCAAVAMTWQGHELFDKLRSETL